MQKNEKRVKTRDDSTKNAKLHKNISNRTTTVGDRKSYFSSVCLTGSSSFLKISNIFLLHHESFQQQFLQYEHRFP